MALRLGIKARRMGRRVRVRRRVRVGRMSALLMGGTGVANPLPSSLCHPQDSEAASCLFGVPGEAGELCGEGEDAKGVVDDGVQAEFLMDMGCEF
jgi:hypothetical protein